MILRHVEKDDWSRVGTLPHFDGFVFHSGQEDLALRASAVELASGMPGYLYAQVLTRPDPTWGSPTGSPWLDAVNALTAPLATLDGRNAVAWSHGRQMIDWPDLDGGKLFGLVDALVGEVRSLGMRGVMLDLAWFRPRDWMFRFDGPAYTEFPAGDWPYWERRFRKFVQLLGAQFEAFPDPKPHILLEGERYIVPLASGERAGFYREQAQLNWKLDLIGWGAARPGMDVLSVLADDLEAMYALLAESRIKESHWIAFTGHSAEAVDQAYELAAEVGDIV
jgi:hypothetical protein